LTGDEAVDVKDAGLRDCGVAELTMWGVELTGDLGSTYMMTEGQMRFLFPSFLSSRSQFFPDALVGCVTVHSFPAH
jgi:hypothetical protein